MTGRGQTSPGGKKEKSNKVMQRLIWAGIALAILAAINIGYLIMHIAHPAPC